MAHLHILAQLDSLNLVAEAELADALELMIVPEHDLIGGPFGAATTANKRENITTEEHLNDANSSIQVYKQIKKG